MWGALIGAGISAAGSIINGISANNAYKSNMRAMADQRLKNDNWYNRRYNEDPTQSASAQRLIEKAREQMMDGIKSAQGRAAVMGGTEESVAQARQAGADVIANATGQIAADADARKENIEQQYINRDTMLDAKQQELRMQKASTGIAGLF